MVCGEPLMATDHDGGCPNMNKVVETRTMGYDDWKTTEPEELGNELDYFDEFPEDDPFLNFDDPRLNLAEDDFPQDSQREPLAKEDLRYQEQVTYDLVNALQEYLSFATVRDLVKLLAEEI